jgi:hypothetical protein
MVIMKLKLGLKVLYFVYIFFTSTIFSSIKQHKYPFFLPYLIYKIDLIQCLRIQMKEIIDFFFCFFFIFGLDKYFYNCIFNKLLYIYNYFTILIHIRINKFYLVKERLHQNRFPNDIVIEDKVRAFGRRATKSRAPRNEFS